MPSCHALQFVSRWAREGLLGAPIMVCASLKVLPSTMPTAGGALDA
ncbi:hypothetical protein [Mycolicibacterium moriokaense]|uniref:Uncharacterized protein n=1 Tax=Mycolicibacterium moriokaense TaxID=39691 RepID=A0A318H7H9_9MYCO|nr:hypothetical protein [Mycolicibacterium moriokaense]PXX00780.1 hypothetical protein C8E89_13341 [Mycolicibacterium moriokaense]